MDCDQVGFVRLALSMRKVTLHEVYYLCSSPQPQFLSSARIEMQMEIERMERFASFQLDIAALCNDADGARQDLALRGLLCLVCAALKSSSWAMPSTTLGFAQKKERNQILLFHDYESYEYHEVFLTRASKYENGICSSSKGA